MKANRWAIAGALAVMVATIAALRVAPAQDDARGPRPQGRGGFGGGYGGGGGGGFGGGYGGGFGGGFGEGRYDGGRQVAARPEPAPEPPRVLRYWVDEDSDRIDAFSERLNGRLRPAGVDFVDTPLGEAIAIFGEEYDLNLLIDEAGLEDFGLDKDEPVSLRLSGVTLRAALRRLLEPLDLTVVINDGVGLVTTVDRAAARLSLAVYPVQDIVRGGKTSELIEVIYATIAQDTWASNGGGEAEIRPYAPGDCLVIRQTQDGHREIGRLLQTLRKVQTERGPSAKRPVEAPTTAAGAAESVDPFGEPEADTDDPFGS